MKIKAETFDRRMAELASIIKSFIKKKLKVDLTMIRFDYEYDNKTYDVDVLLGYHGKLEVINKYD